MVWQSSLLYLLALCECLSYSKVSQLVLDTSVQANE